MLVGFQVANAVETGTTSSAAYTVMKGDTLSAIAKKFPGTTWHILAQQNNITNANLIYPNTVLTIARTNFTLKATVKNTQTIIAKTAVVDEAACDLNHALDRLQFPVAIRHAIEAKSLTQEKGAVPKRERVFIVSEGSRQYVFEISEHCVYTKNIRMNTAPPESREESCDRLVVGSPLENHATPPPETTPGHITTRTQEVNAERLSAKESEDDFEVRRMSIRRFLNKYVGPPHDLKHMQKVLLQQMYPDSY